MAIKHKGIKISNYWRNYTDAISSVRTSTGPQYERVYWSLQ